MLDVEVNFHDEIPLDVESDEDVVQQVAKYFGELTPEDVKVADNH
jgi:hypothetical protein